ncbi:MAG: hypothetical protein J6D03_06640 [Clostridia bacterium]|nr:hypothetical protein [Clostridia bacterium]
MSFAYRGITHCDECGRTLRDNEFAICDMCRERAKEKNKQTVSVNKDKLIKIYKGYELIQAIAEGKIKEGSEFKVHKTVGAIAILEKGTLHFTEGNKRNLTIEDFLIYTFELIEDEEIDINNIKEFEIDENNFIQTDLGAFKTRKMDIAFLNKINELVRALKQLDKRTRKEKE